MEEQGDLGRGGCKDTFSRIGGLLTQANRAGGSGHGNGKDEVLGDNKEGMSLSEHPLSLGLMAYELTRKLLSS